MNSEYSNYSAKYRNNQNHRSENNTYNGDHTINPTVDRSVNKNRSYSAHNRDKSEGYRSGLGKGALIMNDQDVRQDYLERQMALLAKHMVEDGIVGPPDLRTRAVIKKLGQMTFHDQQVMQDQIHNIQEYLAQLDHHQA